jgi:hypothetical protein
MAKAAELWAETSGWMRNHWPHLLLAPLIFFAFTVVHECAHAAAAWLQGATITDFSVIPDGVALGHMSYVFPAGAEGSHFAVSLAPYALWCASMLAVVALSFRRGGYGFAAASTLFLWAYAGAWGDIVLNAMVWLSSDSGDLSHAFGPSTALDMAIFAMANIAVVALGYRVQKRLYASRALSLPGFGALSMAGASVAAVVPLVIEI